MADEVVTPPVRQSVEDVNSAQANGLAQPQTEKSWYLFWDRLGQMANRQNRMVNVGTHADRPPAANMPNGAIYVEFDRGVIYQNWTGAWQYLAGTMYGTIAPDQRPTDLGSHDAGFDYRTTDQPPREFIWSGTAWVEVTAVTVGTHANRPASASEAEGNLYVEYDRGAIYQNWVGGWEYLAGTMWGTLSPDQRPTDLGSRDAGFDYRTTDAPPREFIWSGSAWIEIGAEYWVNGTLIGTRPALNLIAGSNVTISGADNAGSDRVDVTVSSSGGGGTGGAVSSVFGRTGAVVAQAGDYSAYEVINAVDQTSSYTNPAWILSLAWSKITGLSLTHPNVVTKVGASGTIVEGGITDLSAANSGSITIQSSGNTQIGYAAGMVTSGKLEVRAGLNQLFWIGGPVSGPDGTTIQSVTDTGSTYQTLQLESSRLLLNVNGGYVGVGTSNPLEPLHVHVGTGANFLVEAGAGIGGLPSNAVAVSLANDANNVNVPLGLFAQYCFMLGNLGLSVVNPAYQLQLSSDSAGKPGTNTWTISSDIRTKRNVARFEGDIEVIRRLDPIVAEYNGKASTPEGMRVVSFDPDKLREIVPQCVSYTRGKLHPDDEEETDIAGINTHELFFHLLRAVQVIDKRLSALESKRKS